MINKFSDEIFLKILSALPVQDILKCRLVCRYWRDNPVTLLILRRRSKVINFRSNSDVAYFSWIMRTTPGVQIPFSKFSFHFDHDVATNTVEDFLSHYGLDVTGLAMQFYIVNRQLYDESRFAVQRHNGYTPATDYRHSVPLLLTSNISNVTSLYLVIPFKFDFPVTQDSSTTQFFPHLRKFKVKFALMEYNSRPQRSADQTSIFEIVIKNSPRLEVLSLLYYPYFCCVDYDYPGRATRYRYRNYAEKTMRQQELKKLPVLLSLLPSSSTKVKLRLGLITNTFQGVWNQLIKLDPQPRIVSLAISLPPELDRDLRTTIWNWIQHLPLSKLKFFENRCHYVDIPDLPTNRFYALHVLRLTRLTQITPGDNYLLFPNLKKLSIDVVYEPTAHTTLMSPGFEAFRSLVDNVPHLEHLKLRGNTWEILTAEPLRDSGETEYYLLERIENQRGKLCEILSPIKKLQELKTLKLGQSVRSLCGAAYASATGKLQRLDRIIYVTNELNPDEPEFDDIASTSEAANILRTYHDTVEFPNKYIKDIIYTDENPI